MYGVNFDQSEPPSLKDTLRDKGVIRGATITLVLFGVLLCFVKIARLHVEFFSILQYLSAFCLWMFLNSFAGNFMASRVYFFAIRISGVIPWHMGRFLRAMVHSGILERNGSVFQFAHQTYFSYFISKSRYSSRHL